MQKARLVIDGIIGEADPKLAAFGIEETTVSSQSVQKFIEENSDADTIEVEIRSNGGSVSHGFDIYDQLVNSGKTIITKGYRVNSIATVIFLAGSKRLLSKNAEFVIHNPWIDGANLGGMVLTADVLEQITNDMKQSEDKLFNFYAEKLKLNDSGKVKLAEMMNKDTDLGAVGAIDFGFATGYLESNRSKAAYTEFILANYKTKSNITPKMENNKQVEEKISGIEKLIGKVLAIVTGKKEIKNDTTPMEDGKVIYHDGELGVDSAVYSDEEMTTAVPDGNHTLADGNVITVVGGLVTEIQVVEADNAEIEALKLQVTELTNLLELEKAAKETAVQDSIEVTEKVKTISDELAKLKGIVIGAKKATENKAEVTTDDMPMWKRKMIEKRNNRNKGL